MPVIPSDYHCPRLLRHGHLHTIYAAYRRAATPRPSFIREEIRTSDGDTLQLDWVCMDAPYLMVITHGLEGSTRSSYVRTIAQCARRAGWDVLAWNFRGCGGAPSALPCTYHSGKSEDLREVLRHVLDHCRYQGVGLVGVSVGGNITLKYLAEEGGCISPKILGAVAFSAPIDLAASARQLALLSNRIYLRHFLRTLRHKARRKAEQFPGTFDIERTLRARTFEEFDEHFTAPLNGFESAQHYYRVASSVYLLEQLRISALLVNAIDDPFLPPPCFPIDLANESRNLWLEMPRFGGHVGFRCRKSDCWMGERAVAFLTSRLAELDIPSNARYAARRGSLR